MLSNNYDILIVFIFDVRLKSIIDQMLTKIAFQVDSRTTPVRLRIFNANRKLNECEKKKKKIYSLD